MCDHPIPKPGPFSVVIPTRNEEGEIGRCLESLAALNPEAELIVADGGSTDRTRSLVLKHPKVKWVACPAGRGRQMNHGAREARGEYLVFLHADTRLPAGAFTAMRAALTDRANVAGSFRLAFDPPTPLLNVYGWMSGWNSRVSTYGDQAFFLRRELFLSVGGFRDYPICEDLEFQNRMRRLGNWIKLKEPVRTSARRFQKRGPLRQQLLNAGIVLGFYLGVAPDRLHRLYDPPG